MLPTKPVRIRRFRSQFIYGGSILNPDIIEVDDIFITLRRRKFLFSSPVSISMPLNNVIKVEINTEGSSKNILIESIARRQIRGRGFSPGIAVKIKALLYDFQHGQ